jgi:ribosomal-protein-alanine N-acetyltransferase
VQTKSPIRVLIRPAFPEDCKAFLAAVYRNRAFHRPWSTPKPTTPKAFHDYIKRYSTETNRAFFVVLRDTGELVGVINLQNIVRRAFQNAAVGYYAFAPFNGQGLMQEGLQLVVQHAFRKLKLHRLEANIQPHNRASIALARRCGFVKEGFSPRMLKVGGRWRDHERWVLLVEDFRRRK